MKLITLLLITTSLSAQLTDKDKHFLVNSCAAPTISVAMFKLTERPILSMLASIFIMSSLNVGKEIWDGYGHGTKDPNDIIAGSQGLVTGSFISGGSIVLDIHHKAKVEQWKYDNIAPIIKYIEVPETMEPTTVIDLTSNEEQLEIKI